MINVADGRACESLAVLLKSMFEIREEKKQAMKYVYFVCIGMVFGYIIGVCVSAGTRSGHDDTKTRIYETDTVGTVNGWTDTSTVWTDSLRN